MDLTPAEISRDLASLAQLLPANDSPARAALEQIAAMLQEDRPNLIAAAALAEMGLDAAEQDDAEERAILAALVAILAPQRWIAHTGTQCPVDGRAIVRADLGDGQPLTDRADALHWGQGAGPDGEGRIHRFAVVGHA